MNSSVTAIIVLGMLHLFFVAPALWNLHTLPFTLKQKIIWMPVVLLLPLFGILIFHLKYKLAWFLEGPYELNTEESVSRSDGGVGNTGIVRFKIDE